jgi:hypothetical protein
MTDHISAIDTGFPPDFAAFQEGRRRFLDRMNGDAVLWQVAKETRMDRPTLDLNGELTVLTAERRLVLGYFAPGQSDLADAVRDVLGFEDEAFGVGRVGRVRITIERVPEA